MRFIFLAFLIPQALYASQSLYIKLGATQKLPAAKKVWVENGSVVRISEAGGGFEVRGLKVGSSLVRLDQNEIQIFVITSQQIETEKILQPIINHSIGLKLEWKNGELAVMGRLVRRKDWTQLAEACKSRQCHYSMNATMQPELWNYFERQIQKKMKWAGLPTIKLNPGNAEVRVSDKSPHLPFLKEELSVFGIKVTTDTSAIELAPLIRVNITVAEVKKETAMNYGIKWPANYNAQLLPKLADAGETQLLSLQFLEKTGNGKILANPNILCRSGKEAEFLAGGEFPIKILNYKVQDVIWKKYGIVLKVKPVADHSGRMSISIETEVSSIDTSRTVDGIPGLYTNRVQSHFDLNESRTIALSGLIKSEQGQSSEGLPGFKNIPVLGSLFSSKDWRENRTELVIFVRPEIVDPASDSLPSNPVVDDGGQI